MEIVGYHLHKYTTICPRCNAVIKYMTPEIQRGGFLRLRKGIHCPKCNKFLNREAAFRELIAMFPHDYEEKYG